MEKFCRIIFSLTILIVGSIHTGFCQNKNLDLIDAFLKKRKEPISMSYDLEWKIKKFSTYDTSIYTAKVELLRDINDTLFGGKLIIDLDSMWLGYDGKQIYNASINNSTLSIADPVEYPDAYIKSTVYNELIDYGFLTMSDGIKQFILDSSNKVKFVDTLIDHSACLGIFIKLPDQGDSKLPSFFIALDTVNEYIKKRTFSIYFQENEQYSEWIFSNVRYQNKQTIEKLEVNKIASFNAIVNYQRDTSSNATKRQFDFSTLHGKVLTRDKNILLEQEKMPFIILDFWYSSCYPCIKSIPAVNQIAKAFSNKQVVVYGVNMIDDEQKSKSRLEKFLVNNPMEYETIMVDAAQRSQIYIEGFPTLLILDKNYKVIYSDVGYNENLFEEVSAFLESKLK